MNVEAIKQNVTDVTIRYLESPDMWPFHRLEYTDLQKQIEYVYRAVAPAVYEGFPILEVSYNGIAYLLEDRTIIRDGKLLKPVPGLVDAIKLILQRDPLIQELLLPIPDLELKTSILFRVAFERYQDRIVKNILQAKPMKLDDLTLCSLKFLP